MEWFLNPYAMAAGGLLVSSPIIIHLINRMRFKRLRWAAMEFLLKSQKRNRRRLIIEQLILLALRILLVLLIGFLAARYVGTTLGGIGQGTGISHMFIIDDSLSVSDRWREGTDTKSSWDSGRAQIQKLITETARASAAQEITVYLLSDLEHPIMEERLSDGTADRLDGLLKEKKPSYLHLSPLAAFVEGKKLLHPKPQGQKVLHVVSDFRSSDWDAGADVDKIPKAIDDILEDGINLSLIDVAHPSRALNRGVANGHDNIAILDLRPSTRIAAENVDVVFTVKLANYSRSEKHDTLLKVLVDGKENQFGTKQIPRMLPGQTLEEKFTLSFTKTRNGPQFINVRADITSKDPDQRDTGLEADKVRDVVIELRKKVPILVVDGAGPDGKSLETGDWKTLAAGLEAGKAYEPIHTTAEAQAKTELDDYPTIYILDVAKIDEEGLKKLKAYADKGGSIVWFVGPRTDSTFVNEKLFKEMRGLFPVPIQTTPVDLLADLLTEDRKTQFGEWLAKHEGKKEPEAADFKRLMRRAWILGFDPRDETKPDETKPPRILQGKVLFRDKSHPFVHKDAFGLARLETYYYDNLLIAKYFRPLPVNQWPGDEDLKERKDLAEVITMPQIRSTIDDFKEQAQELVRRADEQATALANEDKDYQKQASAIVTYRRDIREALGGTSLALLDKRLEQMLEDQGDERNPDKPDMPKLWSNVKMKRLGDELKSLLDRVRYGDPLVYTKPYGRGRVVAVLTTAGTAEDAKKERWNEWGNGPAQWTYPNFIRPMQGYLASQGDRFNRTLGVDGPIELTFDKDRYKPTGVKIKFIPQVEKRDAAAKPGVPTAPTQARDLPPRDFTVKDSRLLLTHADIKEPGVYTFELTPPKGDQTDTIAFAYNVDSASESNLERTETSKLQRGHDKTKRTGILWDPMVAEEERAKLITFEQPDAAKGVWIYLLFLFLLIAEQAMAVHLSFHVKGGEAGSGGAAAPAAAPARSAAA
jgi:hypothetical protein